MPAKGSIIEEIIYEEFQIIIRMLIANKARSIVHSISHAHRQSQGVSNLWVELGVCPLYLLQQVVYRIDSVQIGQYSRLCLLDWYGETSLLGDYPENLGGRWPAAGLSSLFCDTPGAETHLLTAQQYPRPPPGP
jgi:hypothetical protein